MTFEEITIQNTINKLINGEEYRGEILKSINASFLDFSLEFFKRIVDAKMNDQGITLDRYKKTFINSKNIAPEEAAIFAGMNKKSIMNMYGTATKEVMIDVANENIEYLSRLLNDLESEENNQIDLKIKISYKSIVVELTLSESLIVINALATKKMAIRGGAWSSIGKKVEKPLIDRLCDLCGVPKEYRFNLPFAKDKSKTFDREIDYQLIGEGSKFYKIEVKLMGKGNPESADATIARNSDIFVADTLSEQNKNQLKSLNIEYVELKNNPNSLNDFKRILEHKNIPHSQT